MIPSNSGGLGFGNDILLAKENLIPLVQVTFPQAFSTLKNLPQMMTITLASS